MSNVLSRRPSTPPDEEQQPFDIERFANHPEPALRQYYRDSQAAAGLIASMRRELAVSEAADRALAAGNSREASRLLSRGLEAQLTAERPAGMLGNLGSTSKSDLERSLPGLSRDDPPPPTTSKRIIVPVNSQPVAQRPAEPAPAPQRPAPSPNAIISQNMNIANGSAVNGLTSSTTTETSQAPGSSAMTQQTPLTQQPQSTPQPVPAPAPPQIQPSSTPTSCCPNPYVHLTSQEREARRAALLRQLEEIQAQIRLLDSAAGGVRVGEFARTLAEHRRELDAGLRNSSPFFPSEGDVANQGGLTGPESAAGPSENGAPRSAAPVKSHGNVTPFFKPTAVSHNPYQSKSVGPSTNEPVSAADPFIAGVGEGLSQKQQESLAAQKRQYLDLMQARNGTAS